MIEKELIKEYLNVDKRKKIEKSMEDYIDKKIKEKLLEGKTMIYISTGCADNLKRIAKKNIFYNIWCSKDIPSESLSLARDNIINKYSSVGLIVERMSFDEGWNTYFEGLLIKVPEELR